MAFDLSALEAIVLETPAGQEPDFQPKTTETVADVPTPVAVSDLIGVDEWLGMWAMAHMMGGAAISERTQSPCPLGEQALSEQGKEAGIAAYKLIKSQPAIARFVLSRGTSTMKNLFAVAAHGYFCLLIVKASARGETALPVDNDAEPVFSTTRKEAE